MVKDYDAGKHVLEQSWQKHRVRYDVSSENGCNIGRL